MDDSSPNGQLFESVPFSRKSSVQSTFEKNGLLSNYSQIPLFNSSSLPDVYHFHVS
jgi:hypothetical protein